jgi:triosephosphate isomerase
MIFAKFFRKKPIVIINFKTYKQGREVVKLAKKIERFNNKIIVGVQPSDVYEVAHKTQLKVFSEHADPFMPGRYTGYIIPEALRDDGAYGTFLNHSEHPVKFEMLALTIKRCKHIGLRTAVFVKSFQEAKKIARLNPTYIIYEPPELVSGNISVSSAKPSVIKKFSEHIGRNRFLVGAGIKTSRDVKTALALGAQGVALSSIIMKARKPEKKLKELLRDNYAAKP